MHKAKMTKIELLSSEKGNVFMKLDATMTKNAFQFFQCPFHFPISFSVFNQFSVW